MKSFEGAIPRPSGFCSNVTFYALKQYSKCEIDDHEMATENAATQKYMKGIGLRNGSRMRREAPTVAVLLIKHVEYE